MAPEIIRGVLKDPPTALNGKKPGPNRVNDRKYWSFTRKLTINVITA